MAIKKVINQTSTKISKKEKKEFNSLIRLLRPKVYITDSSSFKRLVQDLTGNGSSDILVDTSLHHQKQQRVLDEEEAVPVIDIEEFYQGEPERSTSVDVSIDASFDSSELYNQLYSDDQELNQLCHQMYSDDTVTTTLEGSTSPADQLVVDTLPFQDLESWLQGTEPFDPFNYGCYGQIDQEVSIYDYELSGIL